jgi:two-component system chemotaxis sensor kinase CheA
VADQLRGDVELSSVAGQGSTLTLKLPRRLSLVAGAVVEAGGSLFVVPLSGVAGVEGDVPRSRDLAAMLGLPPGARPARTLLLKGRDTDVPFAVTRVGEPVEVVRRSVGAHLGRVAFVEGATILPGGQPAFILDARALAAACGGATLSAPGSGAPAPRRVLLVDDSPTLRAKLHQDLSAAGFEIVLAEDGLMALERLAAQPCDAVVSDVQMPHLDGFQLLARCGGEVPVVLITAWPDQVAEVRARELGAAAYIPKDDQLAERVVRALHTIPSLAPETAP